MKCRNCNSDKVTFTKVMGWGPKQGKVYHFKLRCLNCKTSYHVQQTEEVKRLVKDLPWEYSKSYREHLEGPAQEQLFGGFSQPVTVSKPTKKKKVRKPAKKWTFEESDLSVQEGLKGVFVDAGTINNGIKGKQQTTISATDNDGNLLFDESIGDKTINEGEISVLIRAMEMSIQLKQPFKIFSDSQIALGWAFNGTVKDKKLTNQLALAAKAKELLDKSGCVLQWVPRDYNKAGHYLEEKYKI